MITLGGLCCCNYRVRSNTLKLGWRARFVGGEVGCEMCGAEEEMLVHLLEVESVWGSGGSLDVRERYGLFAVVDTYPELWRLRLGESEVYS